MRKPKTHFEQVPLEIVRKIVKEELERESDSDGEIDEETLEKGFRRTQEPSLAVGGNSPTGRYRNKL
jgi:hypothetical protein